MREKHEYIELDVYESLPENIKLNINVDIYKENCYVSVTDIDTENNYGSCECLFDGYRWEGILDSIVTNIIRVIRENKDEGLS